MITSLSLSRQTHIALIVCIALTSALLLHWTISGSRSGSASLSFGSFRYGGGRGRGRGHGYGAGTAGPHTGVGLLPSRWTLSGGRIRGGPEGAWGIERQVYAYTPPARGVEDREGREDERQKGDAGWLEGSGDDADTEHLLGQQQEQQVILDTHDILSRTEAVWERCVGEDEFERYFGRTNLRLSRAYEGSHFKLRRFVEKLLRGEDVTVAVIGGSVSKGHHVEQDEIWFTKLSEWISDFYTAGDGDLWNGHEANANRAEADIVRGDEKGKLQEWVRGRVRFVNGAKPAVGSDYFSFCFPLHIPPSTDLVLVELAVNDAGVPEHAVDMENLLRGLLEMDHAPAVVLVEAMAFSNGGMGGGGGRMHLPVAQYYDVPVINQRHIMANHLARYPELSTHFYAHEWWGVDTRHIGVGAHHDLGRLVSSLLKDATCLMLSEPDYVLPARYPTHSDRSSSVDADGNTSEEEEDMDAGAGTVPPARPIAGVPKPDEGDWPALNDSDRDAAASVLDSAVSAIRKEQVSHSWPSGALSWPFHPNPEYPKGRVMPGILNTPPELGLMPRMPVLAGWNPDLNHRLPPFRPMCLSTDSREAHFNLTSAATEGWAHWVHPDHLDKPYLRATTPGSWVEFAFETSLGIVKVYALRSRSFGLGDAECWVDGERDRAVRVEGYWDKNENIGQNTVIRDDLAPGRHTIRCEVLEDTHDPDGGTEVRMVSLMSL